MNPRREEAREPRLQGMSLKEIYLTMGASKSTVVNSDPDMLCLFARFLRQEMQVKDEEMVIHIHCHTTDPNEINRIEQYWLELLNLPQAALRKTMVKKGSNTRFNILHNGVCGLRVKASTRLIMHNIYGAIQEYSGFERPEWLF